jgi:hypothetical protein
LGRELAVLQAPMFDGLSFYTRALGEDLLAPAEEGICRCHVPEALVVAGVVGRPEIDHDTRGVAGTPPIAETILRKIDAASVFIADVTPVAVTDQGKQVANPNVLIELGYAKKTHPFERIILNLEPSHF